MPVDAMPIRPEPEGEDRVLAVAGVVVGIAVRRSGRRGWPGRRTCRGARRGGGRPARPASRRPRASAPRPRCRPGRGSGPRSRYARAPGPVVAQVAVVAEREAAGRVVERLGVGRGRGSTASTAAGGGRGGCVVSVAADALARRDRRGTPGCRGRLRRPPSAVDPGRAPAEAGDAEPLELLGERPQLVEPERLARPGDEVLAHRRDDTRGRRRTSSRARRRSSRGSSLSPGSSGRSPSGRTSAGSTPRLALEQERERPRRGRSGRRRRVEAVEVRARTVTM